MRFELCFCLAVGLVCGCHVFGDPENSGRVGMAPSVFSITGSLSGATPESSENSVTMVDQKVGALHRLSLEPFEVVSTIRLPNVGDHFRVVTGGADNQWTLIAGKTDYSIMRADGETQTSPVPIPGTITGVALAEALGILVLSDDLGDVLLLRLSSTGDIAKSWLGGPLVGNGRVLRSGTVLADGRLIVGLNETGVWSVDIEASLEQQKWVAEDLGLAAVVNVEWMAELPGRPGTLLAASLDHIWLVDINSKSILADEKKPDGMVFAGFFGGLPGGAATFAPHVLAWNSSGDPLIRLFRGTTSGGLTSSDIRMPSSVRSFRGHIQQSLLDESLDRITFVMGEDDAEESLQRLWQFRLDDSLQLTRRDLGQGTDVQLLQSWVLVRYPVTLGKVERQKYGQSSGSKILKGYNLKVLQSGL